MDDGGRAFPGEVNVLQQPNSVGEHWEMVTMAGMTLRDYFAGQVLAGIYAANAIIQKGVTPKDMDMINAVLSYEMADAMIEERNKPSSGGS